MAREMLDDLACENVAPVVKQRAVEVLIEKVCEHSKMSFSHHIIKCGVKYFYISGQPLPMA